MSSGKIIVYGGRGALGAAIVKHFKSQNWVCSLKFRLFCAKLGPGP